MRSLTPSQRETDDRGAVLVLVAVMMTALIGMAALVIDIGSLYVEKRQLQNGGDADRLIGTRAIHVAAALHIVLVAG